MIGYYVAKLKTKPRSSTAKQRQRVVTSGLKRGFELSEIRKMVGGSISKLSSVEASDWIEKFSGEKLPNPPGEKPKPYKGKPNPGVTRMISTDQCEQIIRLLNDCFEGKSDAAYAWLKNNFKVDDPRELLTAMKGGQVIAVLKSMITRKQARV